jgi:hypothetical protein
VRNTLDASRLRLVVSEDDIPSPFAIGQLDVITRVRLLHRTTNIPTCVASMDILISRRVQSVFGDYFAFAFYYGSLITGPPFTQTQIFNNAETLTRQMLSEWIRDNPR